MRPMRLCADHTRAGERRAERFYHAVVGGALRAVLCLYCFMYRIRICVCLCVSHFQRLSLLYWVPAYGAYAGARRAAGRPSSNPMPTA